ncbi:hypothetical protein PsorP6_018231 [Peronosclerospora sorghi]|uniref:Uncharacterized protein n=1 Tax=Peronosclerospora sorghi TaxID=230839 RepID=A0ACC0WE04_9STRA|nr:hypothetical protein PsorP6_018231 [Peronosclerospora sorghi]
METASNMMSSVHAHGQDTCSEDRAGCMHAVVWIGKSVQLGTFLNQKSDVVVTACSVSPDFATDVRGSASGLEKTKF